MRRRTGFAFRPIWLPALLLLVSGSRSIAQDGDADGVVDGQDNCVVVANDTQLDTNRDGLGNRCDTDYDSNGVCNAIDFGIFKAAYLSGVGQPNYNPDVDMDGNGVINAIDFGVFKSYYLSTPGPSGLGCSGTVPCACDAPVLSIDPEAAAVDVGLTWTASAGSGFEIERRAEDAPGRPWTLLDTATASESSYVDSSPMPDFYEYRMRASCSVAPTGPQWSEYSNVVAVELPAACN